MWIFIKSPDGSRTARIDGLSKLTKIEHLRKLVGEQFEDAQPERQRLFFRGKQLEDGQTLFDYKLNLNDVVQLYIRPLVNEADRKRAAAAADLEEESKKRPPTELESCNKESNKEKIEVDVDSSDYYKIGDFVDTCAESDGSWFEADIVKIVLDVKKANDFLLDNQGNAMPDAIDGFKYYVKFVGAHADDSPVACHFGALRPRSWMKLKSSDINIGDTILANYNIEEPKKIGYWYDVLVTSKDGSRTVKNMVATVIVGSATNLESMTIHRVGEFFRIEKPVKLGRRSAEQVHHMQGTAPPKRDVIPECSHCKDDFTRLCKHCSCSECGGKDDPSKQLICDECQMAFHTYCLTPPLDAIPADDWYCNDCRLDTSEVVNAGEKLKESKKKAKMASQMNNSKRDWGKGMACQGRENSCTIVPNNHFGPIPGVEVGSSWRYRLQASAAGVHRPHVAGISGREKEGAYSIVLSGGYVDDKDEGDTFHYTGSGGRDLTGNKRTAKQSCDQELTRMNRALAVCCNAPVNEKGAVAKDWKKGKEVRVVRKQSSDSKYAPEEGLRYDGIYKVVRYWSEVGKSGFKVWKYEFRRDDLTPAPWTKEGKRRIKTLGLTMQVPIGYEDKIATKESAKRASKDDHSKAFAEKKLKSTNFKLPPDLVKLITRDERNEDIWKVCLESVSSGQESFISKVKEEFNCIVCQDVVLDPITLECGHNTCKMCLKRAVKADMTCCPACRHELKNDFQMNVNEKLSDALKRLLQGYENGR